MGEYIWERVGPSFRRLRVLLQNASMVAAASEAPRIDRMIAEETFRISNLESEEDEIDEDDSESEMGEMEYASVRRKRFKARQRQGR